MSTFYTTVTKTGSRRHDGKLQVRQVPDSKYVWSA